MAARRVTTTTRPTAPTYGGPGGPVITQATGTSVPASAAVLEARRQAALRQAEQNRLDAARQRTISPAPARPPAPTIGGPGGPVFDIAPPTALPVAPPATGGGATDGTSQAIQQLAEMIANMTNEMNKRDAARDALEQARNDTQFSQNAASQQLTALEVLGTPRTNMFSQFARNEPGIGIPIPGEAGAWIQQNQTPGFGTVSGNITTVPNDPYSAQRAFQAAIRGATSRGINDLSETGRDTLFGLGSAGGLDPAGMWREREAAIPRASRLYGSRVI